MSYSSKKYATEVAEEVIKNMKIGEWEMRVHNNLGWHCSIQWGYFNISIYNYNNKRSYGLLVSHGGTGISGINSFSGEDPNILIEEAIKVLPSQFKYWTDVADWIKQIQIN